MLNKKRLTTLATAIILSSLALVGCGSKEVEPLRCSTAEETINLFNKYNEEENTSEMARLYSNVYLDSTGYNLGTVQSILSRNRKDLDVTKSEIKSIEDFDTNTKKVEIEITAKVEDKETTDTYTYAIVKEDSGWSISPDGIIQCENIDIPAFNKKELNLRYAKRITLFEGGILRVNVFNDSKTEYMFGNGDDKCEVVVETNEGTFTTVMPEPVKVEKNLNSYFMARMDTLSGDIKKVSIKNIFELDKNDNVILDTKQEITIYQK